MNSEESFQYRFGGITRLYGEAGLARLRESHVMVIGLGGVGSWAAEHLARTAIGELTLVDFDEVCLSNTNRQLHALDDQYGRMKVEVMAERLKKIQPLLKLTAIDDFFDQNSAEGLLDLKPDFVIDAIDSLDAKCLLIDQCNKKKQPLIVSGGAGGLTNPLDILMCDLSRSFADPLLHSVRKRLRQDYAFPRGKKKFGIPCVFSKELPYYPQEDGTVTKDPAKKPKRRLDCHGGLGTSATVTATFGAAMASHVLNQLTAQPLLTPSEEA